MKERENNKIFLLIGLSLLITQTSYSNQESFIPLSSNNHSKKILENTIANNPNSKTAKICCAKVYLKNGDYKEAENLIMQVLEEEPSNVKANNLLKELNEKYTKHIEKKNIFAPIEQEPKQETYIIEEKTPLVIEKKKENVKENIKEKEKEKQIIQKYDPKPKQENRNKLPTKEEILKKAKEKKLAESKQNINKPANKIESDVVEIQINDKDTLPIVSATPLPNYSPSSDENDSKELIEPIIIDKSSDLNLSNTNENEKKKLNLNVENQEYNFVPYVANQYKNQNKNNNTNKSFDTLFNANKKEINTNNTKIDESNYIEDTNKNKFLEETKNSFSVNLQEANSLIQNNKLSKAEIFLDTAFAIAISEANNKKLLEVQLTRAMLYLYKCDLDKYGKHILSISKGLPEEIFNSLQKVYEDITKLPNNDYKLKYIANLAYNSGNYNTALNLANQVSNPDNESNDIASKSQEMINKINGEYLLNNGQYFASLDVFERENNEIEKGRAYLAISKSLLDSNDLLEAKIAEKFGISTLMNYLSNDPNHPKANLYIALYFLDKGNKNQAKEAIRRGLNSQDNNEIVTSKLLNLSENL